MQHKLGIIAGGGDLPRRVINACNSSGRPYYTICIEGHSSLDLVKQTHHSWLAVGKVGSCFSILRNEQVKEVLMIGDVKMPSLLKLRPDFRTVKFLFKIFSKSLLSFVGDNSLLSAAVVEFEKEGFKVIGVDDILDDLFVPEGVLGSVCVSLEVLSDIDFGILSALSLGERDVGQAVIVKSGKVIIEEGKKGTADMLKRSRNLFPNGAGGILIKLKKPGQDRRMDLPTIGVNTIEQASQAGLIGIVVQAGDTIVIDQKAVIRTANEKGIFIKAINLKEPI